MRGIIATSNNAYEGIIKAKEILSNVRSANNANKSSFLEVENNPKYTSHGYGIFPNEERIFKCDATKEATIYSKYLKERGNVQEKLTQNSNLRLTMRNQMSLEIVLEDVVVEIYLRNYNKKYDSKKMLKCIFARKLGVCEAQLEFFISKYGKTHLKNNLGFHFNLSHTNDVVIIVIANKPVGVDIEKVDAEKDEAKLFQIARRFFTENENRYINGDEGCKVEKFYEIWTRKEAYVKCLGGSLIKLISKIDVLDNEINQSILTFKKDSFMISIAVE